MDAYNSALGIDLSRSDGSAVTGWDHVLQCLEQIFITEFGESVLREWFGSNVPGFLGRTNLNATTVLQMRAAIASAIDQWEPRFEVRKVEALSVDDGRLGLRIIGIYRPLALIGIDTSEDERSVLVNFAGASIYIQ